MADLKVCWEDLDLIEVERRRYYLWFIFWSYMQLGESGNDLFFSPWTLFELGYWLFNLLSGSYNDLSCFFLHLGFDHSLFLIYTLFETSLLFIHDIVSIFNDLDVVGYSNYISLLKVFDGPFNLISGDLRLFLYFLYHVFIIHISHHFKWGYSCSWMFSTVIIV